MIDTLMTAYTVETVSIEKVMACMQQYSTDDQDGDVPYDTEDAVTSWMNKVSIPTVYIQCAFLRILVFLNCFTLMIPN